MGLVLLWLSGPVGHLLPLEKKMPLTHYSCWLGSLGHDQTTFPGSLLFGQSRCILSFTVSWTTRTTTTMVLCQSPCQSSLPSQVFLLYGSWNLLFQCEDHCS